MARFTMLAVALFTLAVETSARGQDSDQVKLLKKEIETLQAKLETANLKIEKLQADLDKARKGEAKPAAAAGKQVAIGDLLPEGATLSNLYQFQTGDRHKGSGTLTIASRDGDSFTGTLVGGTDGKPAKTAEVKGKIRGMTTVTIRSVNLPTDWEVTGTLRKDGSCIEWSGNMPGSGSVKGTLTPAKK